MANKTTPSMSDYWNKSTITEADCSTYHTAGSLGGGLKSLVPLVDVPTIDVSTMVCFEYHLIARLDLPPNKFLVAVMNFLECELVHLNPNAIAALSYFTMLCECWLGIALDTSMCWYFYSLAHYDKVIYYGIALSLHRSRRKEYIDATFKSPLRGSSRRWFLVDMHTPPQWVNRYMLSPLIDDKRAEPEMTLLLTALVQRVAGLRDVSLQACHCAKEFTFW
jgi:hypothetical protein